jgi:hypothetical protein
MPRPFVYSEMNLVGTVLATGFDMYWKLFSFTKMTGTLWLAQLRTALK